MNQQWFIYPEDEGRQLSIVDSAGLPVATVDGEVSPPVQLQYARLIVAAPDLLAALQDMVRIVEPNLLTHEATKAARAAVKKATGV